MELVSTSDSFFGLIGFQIEPSGHIHPVWDRYYEDKDCLLKALPFAEKGSSKRYRVFAGNAKLELTDSGDEYRVAAWKSDQEPIAVLKGFYSEMRDIPRLEALCGRKLSDINSWLYELDLD